LSRSSLYEFGASEEVVRAVQRPIADFFARSAPVLDIGCGRGMFLQLLAERGVTGVGVDHADEALAFCREKGFQVHKVDIQSFLRSNVQQFGGIFCSHVIEHLDPRAATELLQLCFAALRPGGYLVLITPNPEDVAVMGEIFWLDLTHVRPYPAALLRSMLHAEGFEVTRVRKYLGDWRMIGRRNLPAYLWRRLIMGRYFGKPNTLIYARRPLAERGQ
jgi:2-polyprenyl-3-methyl-5-hydroxy-6-metoxy-1,4-benzoquinol methylase